MKLNRDVILDATRNQTVKETCPDKQLTFLINRNEYMCKEIKKLIKECNPDIDRLFETRTRIIVAERKNASIGLSVFAKSSFSRLDEPIKDSQKCNSVNGCMLCPIMNLKKSLTLWKSNAAYKQTIKLDFRHDCLTECVIYLYVCNICENNESFYVGQT